MAIVYIMASQDLISQFSQDTNAIPASQPDRSRTPRRPQHGWHQTVPTFRGPMHFAMTPRPFWHPAGIPPPPSTSPSFSPRPTWTQTTPPFPPTPPTFSQQPLDHTNLTPQRHTLTPRSPRPMSSPGGSSAIHEGYTCRPIEIPPVEQWKPDIDFHDSNKVNGLDFPSRIRQSRFSSYKDIEGMDPLQVPLWKFLYQGLHNTWLRRVAYGRETFGLPFDNIGTTVFVARIGLATTYSECGFGQVSHFQVPFCGPMCEPKGGYPEHGERGCSAAPILASSSTIRGRCQSTTHS